MTNERGSRAAVWGCCAGLFALNAWICRELFSAGFLHNLTSNEAAFAAVARFFRQHPGSYQWFPWFNGGMPIEFAYQPLLPVLSAVTSALTGWPDVRAMHAVAAMAYCLAPVTLFLFVRDYAESITVSLTAALTLSVASPAAMLVQPLLETGPFGDLRLFNIVHFGEDSHALCVALLPLALLFLRKAIVRGGVRNRIAAAGLCGVTVLASPFGAIDLALGSVSMVVAEGRGIQTVLLTGLASWCWIAPWLPPSLMASMKAGAWSAQGSFDAGMRTVMAIVITIALFALIWFGTRGFRRSFDRFACLFAVWMCSIPLGYFWLGWTVIPQANRYEIELEIVICVLFGMAVAHAFSLGDARMRAVLVILLVLAGARPDYRFYRAPRMFENVLPVLWREDDATIYGVPQRSSSLAHVIPRGAVVSRQPRGGSDTGPLREYAAALDDAGMPPAVLSWHDPSHGVIRARMNREEVLSIQITYNRGWRARARDREVPVSSDKLGLMVIDPGCEGDCQVELNFGARPEMWMCRILSAAATLTGTLMLIRSFFSEEG